MSYACVASIGLPILDYVAEQNVQQAAIIDLVPFVLGKSNSLASDLCILAFTFVD